MDLSWKFLTAWQLRSKPVAFMVLMLALVLLAGSQIASAQTSKEAGTKAAPPSNKQLASPEIERRVNELLKKMTLGRKTGAIGSVQRQRLLQSSADGRRGGQPGQESDGAPASRCDGIGVERKAGLVAEHGWTGSAQMHCSMRRWKKAGCTFR